MIDDESKTITYGLYPQNHVSDETTIASLNALTTTESNGWYLLDGEYYAKTDIYHYYGVSDGYFDDGTKIINASSAWFKCEPIRWKILSSSDYEYSLVAAVPLYWYRYTRHVYQGARNGVYASNYANSEIRAWLNEDFFSSAFALDSSCIQTTEVDNSISTFEDGVDACYACDNTRDNVYLLSYQDYYNLSYFVDNSARQCKVTDWVKANGAYYSTYAAYLNNADYWTRTPSRDSNVRYVSFTGVLGSHVGVGASKGIRPGITLKIQ